MCVCMYTHKIYTYIDMYNNMYIHIHIHKIMYVCMCEVKAEAKLGGQSGEGEKDEA